MNVEFRTQSPYSNLYRTEKPGDVFSEDHALGKQSSRPKNSDSKVTQEIRQKLRNLNQTAKPDQNPHQVTTERYIDQLTSGKAGEKQKTSNQTKYHYNSKEVSSRILRAKNSISAGQAVLSAKRKVLEIRRKIARGGDDAEELQLALTHARRMEMAARKKKHHLEIEELIVQTQKRDEQMDRLEDAGNDLQRAVLNEAEEEIARQEDEVFEMREEVMSEISEQIEESGVELSDDLMDQMGRMVAELGEDQLDVLEESMEMLEAMEVVDPHMSKEDFEELKIQHRNSERKAILKADMDYLKGMAKLQEQASPDAGMPSAQPAAVAPPISIDVQA